MILQPSTLCPCCSVAQSCLTLCNPMDYSTPGFPVLHHLQSLLKFTSILSVMPSNHLIHVSSYLQSFPTLGSFLRSWLFAALWTVACQTSLSFTISRSLLKLMSTELVIPSNHLVLCCPLFLTSIFPSIRVFSSELALHIKWPKNWNFSFSISPSNEYSGLISFRIDCFHLLAVQGTLKSLLQHHSSKASILQHSAFFMIQLSHPYMTTGKTIALTRQTFVSK